ncbi:hypothetical protein JCGZ_09376 [Jatropha curcas]|uniref:Uncharacterized protein n=1 Tax=Jatropha curcas TaxID=180498 RepID=A0A067KGK4_JATCU|nr:hypothetical protein JCGZ_09376 [Jatropha curcas]
MTLRDTINRILESGSGSSSSGINVQSNSVKVTKSETHISSSSEKEQKQSPSLAKIEDKSNNGKAVDVPHPLAKKAKTARAADVSEVTTGSIRKSQRTKEKCSKRWFQKGREILKMLMLRAT